MNELDTAVVEGDASAAVAEEATKPKPRSAPKWETEARDRLRAAIRRFSKPLADLVARDANEGDTRLLATDFLCDGLGFDKYADLTTEYQVKGEFADYGIRIDRELVAFIEVKRVATKLSTRHLRQVEMYAVNEGVEWIILTNGSVWQVYHITGGLPVAIDLALEVDLLGDEQLARLRKSYIALYGEQEPQAGLRLAQEATTLAATAGSHALQGLALLHIGEGHAVLGDRRDCEAALGAAEAHLQAMQTTDPAHGLLSADRLERIQGSCYLALGDSAKAESVLEGTARRLHGRHKSKAIILGNLALAYVRQRDVDQAATVLHRAIDLLEVSRGGGGLNVVSAAIRELRPWRQEPVAQEVHERLLALMTLN